MEHPRRLLTSCSTSPLAGGDACGLAEPVPLRLLALRRRH